MKVKIYTVTDEKEEEKFMNHEEFMDEIEKEEKEKNLKILLRNWLDDKFPNGIAEYRAYYTLTHPWIIIGYWKRQIKYAWQRAFRGWDDTALWGIDSYLAKIILQLVRKLKEDNIGIPVSMFEGLPCDENYPFSEESVKIAKQRWIEVQDKIIEGFESYLKLDFYPETISPKEEEYKRKFEEGFDLFREHFSILGE
jgi:hypothetical protein